MPVPASEGLHRRSLLRDHVYESIRDAIVDGTLQPGERLRDAELERWLGVSRTPIREALLRLERAGMIVATPGRGTLVAPVDPEATLDAQQVIAAVHELAARLGTPHVDEAGLAAMRAANAAFDAATAAGDVEAALLADDDLHGVLVEASGNAAARSVLEQWTPVVRRVARQRFSSENGRASVAAHERIIAAVAAGDASAAAEATRENWLSLRYRPT